MATASGNVFSSPFSITADAINRALAGSSANLSIGGTLTVGGAIAASAGNIGLGAAYNVGWSGRSFFSSPADGRVRLNNNAGTDFTMVQFGGGTASFPAIKRYSGAALFQFRKADDSAFVGVELDYIRFGGKTLASAGTAAGAGGGAVAYITDLNAPTRGSTAAGGGSSKGLVLSDGTNWIVV